MVIAKRLLTLRQSAGAVEIPVTVFRPVADNGSWKCDYEIGWPEGKWSSAAWGYDSIQSIVLALQKMGFEIYASEHHKSGRLAWEKAGTGYGFPVPHNARDMLIGDDAKFF